MTDDINITIEESPDINITIGQTQEINITLESDSVCDWSNVYNKPENISNIDEVANDINGELALKANTTDIPINTSDLTNDSNFVSDANYIHTDNNLTNVLKARYDIAYERSHEHNNKTILDNTTSSFTGELLNKTNIAFDHTSNTSNPHSVTKAQVGLGNVQNLDTTTTSNINEGSNLYYTEARVSNNTDVSNATAHIANTSNPHSVTKTQIGLGNVPNLDTTNAVNNQHTHSNKTVLDNTTASFTTAQEIKLSNISGTNTGDETQTTIKTKLGAASNSADGYLTSTDWNTFNNKVSSSTTVNGKALSSNISVGSYSMQGFSGYTSTLSASTTYYFGSYWSSALQTTTNDNRIYIPKKGVISSVYVNFKQTTISSTETSSLYIRVNNTTDYLISNNISTNAGNTYINNSSLSASVNQGDYIHLKWVTPAWTTNAGGSSITAQIGIDL